MLTASPKKKTTVTGLLHVLYLNRAGKTIELTFINDELADPELASKITNQLVSREKESKNCTLRAYTAFIRDANYEPKWITYYQTQLEAEMDRYNVVPFSVFEAFETARPDLIVFDTENLNQVIEETRNKNIQIRNKNKISSTTRERNVVTLYLSVHITVEIFARVSCHNAYQSSYYVINGKDHTSMEDFVRNTSLILGKHYKIDEYLSSSADKMQTECEYQFDLYSNLSELKVYKFQELWRLKLNRRYEVPLFLGFKQTLASSYNKKRTPQDKDFWVLYTQKCDPEIRNNQKLKRSSFIYYAYQHFQTDYHSQIEKALVDQNAKVGFGYVTMVRTEWDLSDSDVLDVIQEYNYDAPMYVDQFRDLVKMYQSKQVKSNKTVSYPPNQSEMSAFLEVFLSNAYRLSRWYKSVIPNVQCYGFVVKTEGKIEYSGKRWLYVIPPPELRLIWNASSASQYRKILNSIEFRDEDELNSMVAQLPRNQYEDNGDFRKKKANKIDLERFYAIFDAVYPFVPKETVLFSGMSRRGRAETQVYEDLLQLDSKQKGGSNDDTKKYEKMIGRVYEANDMIFTTWHFNTALDQLSPFEEDGKRQKSCVFVWTLKSDRIKGVPSGVFHVKYKDLIALNKGLTFRIDAVETNLDFMHVFSREENAKISPSLVEEREQGFLRLSNVRLDYLVRVSVFAPGKISNMSTLDTSFKGYGKGFVPGVTFPTKDWKTDFNQETLHYALRNNKLRISQHIFLKIRCDYRGTRFSNEKNDSSGYFAQDGKTFIQYKEIKEKDIPDFEVQIPYYEDETLVSYYYRMLLQEKIEEQLRWYTQKTISYIHIEVHENVHPISMKPIDYYLIRPIEDY